MNKDILKICHDNTHSTSRIFRNIKLLKKDIANDNWGNVEKRLDTIEKAAMECRQQVDNLYLIIKEIEIVERANNHNTVPKFKDEWGNTDWRDTGEMGG